MNDVAATGGSDAPSHRHRGSLLHREGRGLLPVCGTVLLASTLGIHRFRGPTASRAVAALSLIAIGFLLRFFRHPGCTTPSGLDLVVAPASGHVVHIGLEEEREFLGDRRQRVSIFLSIFDAHLTRSPLAGRVLAQCYHPGQHLVALHEKSSALNERNSILLGYPGGERVLVRQIAGYLARRICSYVAVGDVVTAGEEIGFIKLGSRVDLFLPTTATILVHRGQAVRAGETPLARLRMEPSTAHADAGAVTSAAFPSTASGSDVLRR